MIITEYRVSGPAQITIAIVADLHEFEPKPVLSRLASINPDVIAVPGDLFENHEFGENLDKEDDSLISRLLCRIIHITNRLAGLRWRQKHRCSKQNAYDFLMKASEIAPVVMSLGNHELYLTEDDKAVLQDAKVTLLNNSTVEIKNVLFGGHTLQADHREDRHRVPGQPQRTPWLQGTPVPSPGVLRQTEVLPHQPYSLWSLPWRSD